MMLIAGSFMSKSNPIYPNPIMAYSIRTLFSGNHFSCLGDHGYYSNNAIMNWWTHEDLNTPLAEQAKKFGFYDAIKELFANANVHDNPANNCYNIFYLKKRLMLPIDENGDFIIYSDNEETSSLFGEAISNSMIMVPASKDFAPILITTFSNDENDQIFEAIDSISIYSSMITSNENSKKQHS